jgi:hypothetical protein
VIDDDAATEGSSVLPEEGVAWYFECCVRDIGGEKCYSDAIQMQWKYN